MENKTSISIDGWQIDALSHRISRDGVEKKLEPRSMELLIYLADRPNQVVTRQEIEENVWKGRIVGYDALSGSIAKIRKALGDTSKNPRIIETIPKSGYRLIAPVLVEAEEAHIYSGDSTEESFERKLTAILYADVAGYSRLSGEDEDRTHQQLRKNMKTISDAITGFHGRIIHYAGDAVLADFSTASAALHCALDVQQKISAINSHLAENKQVLFRIGVNLGEVIVDGDEIYGDGVNIAARLESLAEPGSVCISGAVFDAIGQKQSFDFEFHGEKLVKNISRPIQTYTVQLKPGVTIPVPEIPPPSQQPHTGKHGFKISPLPGLGIAVIIISLVVGGFFVLNPRDSEIKSNAGTANKHFDPVTPSLAILPFRNMSNDPGQSVYSDGLTDDLITDLSNIDGLKVTPRYSSFGYETNKISPLDIARELRVRYIVQGSVRRSFEDIRVNVQLVDTQSNQEIWAQRFDDNIENIFKLQDQIIGKILDKINLGPRDKPQSKRRTTNLEAYDFFLRAEHRRLNNTGPGRPIKTIEFYQKAIELDPMFVAAYTGLAREALRNWQLDASQVMPAAASKKLVYETAGKALELDPENAEALAIVGLLQAISGAHDTGIASVKRAVAINPANPQLDADLAVVLSYGGSHEEALESINKAIDRHSIPPSVYFAERAKIYFFLGQFKNALKDAKSAQDISAFSNFSLFIHGAMNDWESAQRYVDARLELIPWENREYYWVIFAYYRRPQDIELIVDSAEKAGIPRFAYRFDPGDSKPLENTSISALTNKGLWQGVTHNGDGFYQQFSPGNSIAIRTAVSMMSGSFHIENNKLCVTYRSVLLDLPDCGYIYPGADSDSYTWVTLGEVYRFSVEH